MPEQTRVTPGLGQDIRDYTPQQLADRAENRRAVGQDGTARQLTQELVRRARPSGR